MVLILGAQAGRGTAPGLGPSSIDYNSAKATQNAVLTDRLDIPLHGPVSSSQKSRQLSTGAGGRYEGESSS